MRIRLRNIVYIPVWLALKMMQFQYAHPSEASSSK